MPHARHFDLRLGENKQHVIANITVELNSTPIPPERENFPGADSGMTIELPAVQQLLALVAAGDVTIEQAQAALDHAAAKLHEGNDEYRAAERSFGPQW